MLKILSLNLWNLNADYKARMKLIDEHIERTNPDIVCLQEVSMETEGCALQTRHLNFANENYSTFFSSQGKWGEREEGLATLAKLPIVGFESLMLPDSANDMQRRVQFTILECDGQKIILGNTHLSYHLDSEIGRIEQCKTILMHFERLALRFGCKDLILVGDLNSTPKSAPMLQILESDLGFRDPYQNFGLQSDKFTFPSNSPYSDKKLWPARWIDYILLAGSLSARSAKLALNNEGGQPFASDHAALEVKVEFKK